MSVPTKLGAFAGGLLFVFGLAFAVGSAVDVPPADEPTEHLDDGEHPSTTTTHPSRPHGAEPEVQAP